MSMRKNKISVSVINWIIQHSIFLLKFKGHKMANIRNAGRPCRTITLNFIEVDDTVNEVLSLCLGQCLMDLGTTANIDTTAGCHTSVTRSQDLG